MKTSTIVRKIALSLNIQYFGFGYYFTRSGNKIYIRELPEGSSMTKATAILKGNTTPYGEIQVEHASDDTFDVKFVVLPYAHTEQIKDIQAMIKYVSRYIKSYINEVDIIYTYDESAKYDY